MWHVPPLLGTLEAALGEEFGLTRGLYFDKPPERTWALPWHQDLTIAVADHKMPSREFTKPTRKAGIPHVEAPVWLLERMLTARIHLDRVTDENGPLKVLAGSHRNGKTFSCQASAMQTIYAEPGDVLLMRPLLAHSSRKSNPGTQEHRRILHLEFAGCRALPDGYQWQSWIGSC